MRVCKHSCDNTRILIEGALSYARFDWLVGEYGHVSRNLLRSRSDEFICQIIFDKYFTKATRGVGRIFDICANPRLGLGFA